MKDTDTIIRYVAGISVTKENETLAAIAMLEERPDGVRLRSQIIALDMNAEQVDSLIEQLQTARKIMS